MEQTPIDIGEQKRVEAPNVAYTFGLDTCMGLAILNRQEKIAYLSHSYNFDIPKNMIERAISEASDILNLEAVMAGNIPMNEEDCADADVDFEDWKGRYNAHANLVYNHLLDSGIRKIRNDCPTEPRDTSYRMEVDPGRGKIQVREE